MRCSFCCWQEHKAIIWHAHVHINWAHDQPHVHAQSSCSRGYCHIRDWKGKFLPSIYQALKIEVRNLSPKALSTEVKIPAKSSWPRPWPRTCLNLNQDLAQDLSSTFLGLNELGKDLVYLGHDSCVCYPQIFVATAMILMLRFLNNDSWVPWP